jgi:hypothetical protein
MEYLDGTSINFVMIEEDAFIVFLLFGATNELSSEYAAIFTSNE